MIWYKKKKKKRIFKRVLYLIWNNLFVANIANITQSLIFFISFLPVIYNFHWNGKVESVTISGRNVVSALNVQVIGNKGKWAPFTKHIHHFHISNENLPWLYLRRKIHRLLYRHTSFMQQRIQWETNPWTNVEMILTPTAQLGFRCFKVL